MPKDARERNKWKVRLAGWIDELPGVIKKPVKKLMGEVVFGILGSGTLKCELSACDVVFQGIPTDQEDEGGTEAAKDVGEQTSR